MAFIDQLTDISINHTSLNHIHNSFPPPDNLLNKVDV